MTEDDKMDELLSEANKMLRMMKDKESSEAKMNKLHQQLDEIKKSMKTLKLTRVKETQKTMRPEEEFGLLDSGATHPLRPLISSDKVENPKTVNVALADGKSTTLLMTDTGVMVPRCCEVHPGWNLHLAASKRCSTTT